MVASTGIIGEQLNYKKINKEIPKLYKKSQLKCCSWMSFAKSIITTDTCPKLATKKVKIGNQNIVIGVSGGADSVALLLLCCAAAMQESANFNVIAAHINHGLRPEANDEQKKVEQLCARLGIQCESVLVNVQPINGSIAAGAREARYEALKKIATSLETVWFEPLRIGH